VGGVNPFVFIVGCPRSGTTLLQRMVDAHPDVAIVHETHWIPRWFEKRKGLTPEGFVTHELVEKLVADRRFSNLGVGPEDVAALLDSEAAMPYASFVSALFDLHARGRGKRLAGDKTPAYVRSLPTLHALWPTARFVHLIRDGRDVALSVTSWSKADSAAGRFSTYAEDPVATTAVWWEWNVRLGREDGAELPEGSYRELRYESLVVDPAGQCSALCDFLDLPYDDAMLRFHEGRTRDVPGLDAKKRWQPVTAGLRSWRSQMPGADAERFDAAAGPFLEELGYERAGTGANPAVLADVREVREAFSRELSSLGHRLPAAWRE
jgi:Sulfotransferase family